MSAPASVPQVPEREPVPALAIAALSFAAFAASASLRVTDPLLPKIVADYGVGLGTAAQVITAFSIAYGTLQLFFGPIGDRFGKYRVIAFACALSTLTAIACALAPTFATLLVARLASGAMAAAVIPLSMAWIGDVVPYEQRQPVLAKFLTGQILGLAGGQLLGGLGAERFGMQAPFYFLAAWFVASSMILFRIAKGHARIAGARPASGRRIGIIAGISYVLQQRWARVVLITVFLEGAFLFGAFAFTATHLHNAYGLSLSAAGGVLTLYGAGGILFAIFSRRMLNAMGEQGLAVSGGALMFAAFAAIALADRWPIAGIACVFAGLGFYMLHNTLQTNATQMAPAQRGTAVSMFASALFLGQSAGVAVAGVFAERIGTRTILLVGGVCVLLVGIGFRRALVRHGDTRLAT
jgi:predicted MFS family arabinose efflux permease